VNLGTVTNAVQSLTSGDWYDHLRLGMSFGNVDAVNALAVEAKIDSILVCLLTQMASKWLLTGMGTKVSLKMV